MSLAITRSAPYFSRSAGISSEPICPAAPVTRTLSIGGSVRAQARCVCCLRERPAGHRKAALVELGVERSRLCLREWREGRAHRLPRMLAGDARDRVLQRRDHWEFLHGEAQVVERRLALIRIGFFPMSIEPMDGSGIDIRGGADAALAAVPHVGQQEGLR